MFFANYAERPKTLHTLRAVITAIILNINISNKNLFIGDSIDNLLTFKMTVFPSKLRSTMKTNAKDQHVASDGNLIALPLGREENGTF